MVVVFYFFSLISNVFFSGTDRVMVENDATDGKPKESRVNECQNFINARYIGATEALWRLFGFPMHKMSPEVTQMAIHLPEDQNCFLKTKKNPRKSEQQHQEEMKNAVKKQERTMLTAFFEVNKKEVEAREYLYPDILKHYTYNKVNKEFTKRVRKTDGTINHPDGRLSNMVGRLPVIGLNMHQKELFFLRMLLYHVKGPTCFEDLKTVNGQICETFQQACIQLGLFEDDSEIEKCLTEAATVKFAAQFRQLFVTLLVQVIPSNPRELYEKFKADLSDDFMKKAGIKILEEDDPKSEDAINCALHELKQLFQASETDMAKFGLPEPDNRPTNLRISREMQEEVYNNIEELQEHAESSISKLNAGQKKVFDAIKDAVEGNGGVFSIDAPGGTGKTFVLTTLLSYVRSKGKIGFAMATSGIAATLLPGGRTVHNRLKVPIKLHETSELNGGKTKGPIAELIKKTDLMIIDEVTMGSKLMFETIDRSLRKLRNEPNKPFGGITLVLSGDWRQCLPVVPKGSRAQIIHETLKFSNLWSQVKTFHLTENMRLRSGGEDCAEFEQYLLRIGEGKEPVVEEEGDFMVRIPSMLKSNAKNVEEFCKSIFPDLNKNIQEGLRKLALDDRGCFEWLLGRAIICPTNADTEEINQTLMKQITGKHMVYRSADKVVDPEEAHKYPQEFLNSVSLSSLPPHILELKQGAPIMLLRNLDPANGHVNGARYFVKDLLGSVIIAEVAVGPHKGKTLMIPRIPFKPEDKTLPFEFTRKQFPIRVCFAITSNKSQGQTLDRVGIYLKHQFFSHGQLYVALSRCRSSEAIDIFIPTEESTKIGKKTNNPPLIKRSNKATTTPIPASSGDFMRNVVYQEALS